MVGVVGAEAAEGSMETEGDGSVSSLGFRVQGSGFRVWGLVKMLRVQLGRKS